LPDEWVLPSFVPRPAALLGFVPFAGLIPFTGGRDISVPPGPRAVRAWSSTPRFIFAGMTGRRLENTCDLKRRSVVRMIWLRLLGFDSRLRSRARSTRSNADPALGFASCRVDGHMAVHPSELEDRFGSPASGAPRPSRFSLAAQLQSAHGFAATPSRRVFDKEEDRFRGICSRRSHPCHARCAGMLGLPARISPSLQRIDGADAWLFPAASRLAGQAPCLRFCTVREPRYDFTSHEIHGEVLQPI
jgi:hypothetical protein